MMMMILLNGFYRTFHRQDTYLLQHKCFVLNTDEYQSHHKTAATSGIADVFHENQAWLAWHHVVLTTRVL